MKLYDISKGYFTAPVYPGDPKPWKERLQQMELGINSILPRITAAPTPPLIWTRPGIL